jgi:hypothetical protein
MILQRGGEKGRGIEERERERGHDRHSVCGMSGVGVSVPLPSCFLENVLSSVQYMSYRETTLLHYPAGGVVWL